MYSEAVHRAFWVTAILAAVSLALAGLNIAFSNTWLGLAAGAALAAASVAATIWLSLAEREKPH